MPVSTSTRLKRVAQVICLGGLIFSLALPVTASPIPMSAALAPPALRAALRDAWENHPTARAAEATLAAAQARAEGAGRPLYNPEVDLEAEREGSDRKATAGLSLTLDLSGKRGVRRDAASARVDQATAEARVRRRDFIKQWLSSWAAFQTAQQRVLSGERRIALVSRFATLAQKQFAADDISGLERDLAQLASAEAQAEQSQLLAERAEAQSRFQSVGGSPAAIANLVLPSDALPAPATLAMPVAQGPEWEAAKAAALAAERDVAVARRNRIADPTVGLRGGRIDYGNVQDNIVGLSVSIPLFLRNSYRAEVVAAQADSNVAAAELARVGIELDAERQRAISSFTTTQSAWQRWRTSRGTDIERRSELLERLWREGELSTSDYLLQLKQTIDTTLAGAELEARLWRAYTDYLAATGQLERWAGMEGTP